VDLRFLGKGSHDREVSLCVLLCIRIFARLPAGQIKDPSICRITHLHRRGRLALLIGQQYDYASTKQGYPSMIGVNLCG